MGRILRAKRVDQNKKVEGIIFFGSCFIGTRSVITTVLQRFEADSKMKTLEAKVLPKNQGVLKRSQKSKEFKG